MDDIEHLKSIGAFKNFVAKQQGQWNHDQWEGFLKEVYSQGFNLHPDIIGLALEQEKKAFWEEKDKQAKCGEETKIVEADEKPFEERYPLAPQLKSETVILEVPSEAKQETLYREIKLETELPAAKEAGEGKIEDLNFDDLLPMETQIIAADDWSEMPPSVPLPEPPKPEGYESRAAVLEIENKAKKLESEIKSAESRIMEKEEDVEKGISFDQMERGDKKNYMRNIISDRMTAPQVKPDEEQIVKNIQREINYIKFLYKTKNSKRG